ncbi:hypothetical protein [Inquilinus sp. OTU3971]|uniref:hypothetical protein n=1 Tax=Inquilinus sp. OTU3971 TaxID=3043855 RepID=UPI00313CC2B7
MKARIMWVAAAIFTLPCAAEAKFLIVPYASFPAGNGGQVKALVIDTQEEKLFLCHATYSRPTPASMVVACTMAKGFSYIQNEGEVVTAPASPAFTLPPVDAVFWQIETNTGALQACLAPDVLHGGSDVYCKEAKLY